MLKSHGLAQMVSERTRYVFFIGLYLIWWNRRKLCAEHHELNSSVFLWQFTFGTLRYELYADVAAVDHFTVDPTTGTIRLRQSVLNLDTMQYQVCLYLHMFSIWKGNDQELIQSLYHQIYTQAIERERNTRTLSSKIHYRQKAKKTALSQQITIGLFIGTDKVGIWW